MWPNTMLRIDIEPQSIRSTETSSPGSTAHMPAHDLEEACGRT